MLSNSLTMADGNEEQDYLSFQCSLGADDSAAGSFWEAEENKLATLNELHAKHATATSTPTLESESSEEEEEPVYKAAPKKTPAKGKKTTGDNLPMVWYDLGDQNDETVTVHVFINKKRHDDKKRWLGKLTKRHFASIVFSDCAKYLFGKQARTKAMMDFMNYIIHEIAMRFRKKSLTIGTARAVRGIMESKFREDLQIPFRPVMFWADKEAVTSADDVHAGSKAGTVTIGDHPVEVVPLNNDSVKKFLVDNGNDRRKNGDLGVDKEIVDFLTEKVKALQATRLITPQHFPAAAPGPPTAAPGLHAAEHVPARREMAQNVPAEAVAQNVPAEAPDFSTQAQDRPPPAKAPGLPAEVRVQEDSASLGTFTVSMRDDPTVVLLAASEKGDSKQVETLLQDETYRDVVNIPNVQGETALFTACKLGHLSTVKVLVESGCDTQIKNDLEDTALHAAVKNGRDEVVKYLTSEAGAEFDVKNNLGNTPLHVAIENDRPLDIIEAVNKDFSVNRWNKHNMTPLMLACKLGNQKVVEVLVKQSCWWGYRSEGSKTALHFAYQNHHKDLTNWLVGILQDEDLLHEDQRGSAALQLASEYGHPDDIPILLKRSAVMEHDRKKRRERARNYAGRHGYKDIVDLLDEAFGDDSSQATEATTVVTATTGCTSDSGSSLCDLDTGTSVATLSPPATKKRKVGTPAVTPDEAQRSHLWGLSWLNSEIESKIGLMILFDESAKWGHGAITSDNIFKASLPFLNAIGTFHPDEKVRRLALNVFKLRRGGSCAM